MKFTAVSHLLCFASVLEIAQTLDAAEDVFTDEARQPCWPADIFVAPIEH